MAKEGYVPVSFGYKEMTLEDLKFYMHQNAVESEIFQENLLMDMNYVCTFGLNNELRLHVTDDVSLIKYGHKFETENKLNQGNEGGEEEGDKPAPVRKDSNAGKKKRKTNMVNVRMVTGDHFETARFVARKAGIINNVEFNASQTVMTGE